MSLATWHAWRRVAVASAFAFTTTTTALARAVEPTTDEQTTPHESGPRIVGAGAAGGVIVDDYLSGATPDEAAEALQWCGAVPGCLAIWRQGVGTTVVLQPGIPDPSMDVGAPDPNTD
jgi:hypothetical protein